MASIRRQGGVLTGLLLVALLATGCGPDPNDQAAVQGMYHRSALVLSEVRAALASTNATTLEQFVQENSVAPGGDEAPVADGLPWFNVNDLGPGDIEARYPHADPENPRDIAVVAIDDRNRSSRGTVQIFVRTGLKETVGFERNPYHFVYACIDLMIDLDSRSLTSMRGECGRLPEVLVALAEPLSGEEVQVGDPWPAS